MTTLVADRREGLTEPRQDSQVERHQRSFRDRLESHFALDLERVAGRCGNCCLGRYSLWFVKRHDTVPTSVASTP